MSLKTWNLEFYPEAADSVSEKGDVECVEHSIQKWTGLLPKNLKKHGVGMVDGNKVMETRAEEFVRINSATCSLCVKHFDEESNDHPCQGCPLFAARGDIQCDRHRADEEDSPYFHAMHTGDPKPMVLWLKRTLQYVKSKNRDGTNAKKRT